MKQKRDNHTDLLLQKLEHRLKALETDIFYYLQSLKGAISDFEELKECLKKEKNIYIPSWCNSDYKATTSLLGGAIRNYYIVNNIKIKTDTIKDYVIQVLSDSKNGLTALEILKKINERFDTQYPRPSLSPQLSRLRRDGVIGVNNSIWYLIHQNSNENL